MIMQRRITILAKLFLFKRSELPSDPMGMGWYVSNTFNREMTKGKLNGYTNTNQLWRLFSAPNSSKRQRNNSYRRLITLKKDFKGSDTEVKIVLLSRLWSRHQSSPREWYWQLIRAQVDQARAMAVLIERGTAR